MNDLNDRFTYKKGNSFQKKRLTPCPGCGRKGCFTPIIDTWNNDKIVPYAGHCDHRDTCGYSKGWRAIFKEHPDIKKKFLVDGDDIQIKKPDHIIKQPELKMFYLNKEYAKESILRGQVQSNNFKDYFIGLLGIEVTNKLFWRCGVGISSINIGGDNWTEFFQIDINKNKNIRTSEIIPYKIGGHRYQPGEHKGYENRSPISWGHKVRDPRIKFNSYTHQFKQVFFGSHLLNEDKTKVVCIVESCKTCLLASAWYPQHLWLASGGESGLATHKFDVLKGRRIHLFPDKGTAFKAWSGRAKFLKDIGYNVSVSDFLERDDTIPDKADLADYLERWDIIKDRQPSEQDKPVYEMSEDIRILAQYYPGIGELAEVFELELEVVSYYLEPEKTKQSKTKSRV